MPRVVASSSTLMAKVTRPESHSVIRLVSKVSRWRGLGGTVLKTNVDPERVRLIQSTLASPAGPPAKRRAMPRDHEEQSIRGTSEEAPRGTGATGEAVIFDRS